MKIEAFISQEFRRKLDERRCLVVYDPAERYLPILESMRGEECEVIACGESIIEAREKAMELWARMGRSGNGPRTMALHIPSDPPKSDEERFADPFQPFALAGSWFPRGDAEQYRSLAERAMPERKDRIRDLFSESEPSFSILNALEGGRTWPRLREMLGVESTVEILAALMAPGPEQGQAMENSEDWVSEALELAKDSLAFQPRTKSRKWDALQRELWRYVLFSEFAFDLPEALPAALESVNRAPEGDRSLVFSLCDRLRSDREALKVYLSKAEEAEAALGLEEKTEGIGQFGERTTFAFEERSILARYVEAAKERDWDAVAAADALRRKSVWADESSRQSTWTLAERATELIRTAEGFEAEISELSQKIGPVIDYYTSRGHRLDTLHRGFEQARNDALSETDILDDLVTAAENAYRTAAEKLHSRFVGAVEKQGWPADGSAKATDVFPKKVAPHLETKGRKIALFMVDALRYELAVTLEADLQSRYPTGLGPACAQLPTITPVGMAALLPGADKGLEIREIEGKGVPHIAGKPVVTPKDRLEHLRSIYGDRCEMIELDELIKATSGRKKKSPIKAETDLLVVKTREIDDQGEIGAAHIHSVLPKTMDKLRAAMHRLEKLGFHHTVVSGDHGFVLSVGESERDYVKAPDGPWCIRKSRCLVGDGQDGEGVLALSAEQAGIRGDVRRYVTPRTLCAFRRGHAYYHEGLSLQECIIPILEVELSRSTRPETGRAEVRVAYRGQKEATVTTRRPAVEVAVFGTDLFGGEDTVFRLEVVATGGKNVGEAAACEYVDSTTGLVKLGHGKAVKIPVRLDDEFQGACEVRAVDPDTGVIHGTPLKLKLKTLE